jgi:hypothetical protein
MGVKDDLLLLLTVLEELKADVDDISRFRLEGPIL